MGQGVCLSRIDIPAVDVLPAVGQEVLRCKFAPVAERLHTGIGIVGIIHAGIHAPACRIIQVEVVHLFVALADVGRLGHRTRRVFNRPDAGADGCRISHVQVVVFRKLAIQGGADVMGQFFSQAGVVLPDVIHFAVQRVVGDEVVARLPFGVVGRIEHVCRHLPAREGKVRTAVALCMAALREACPDFSADGGCVRFLLFQYNVDNGSFYPVSGRCAVHYLRLLHIVYGRAFQQVGQLFARHGRRPPVQYHRYASGSDEVEASALFQHARQAGNGFVGVAGRCLFGQGFQVVIQGAVFDLHQRTFGADYYFVQCIVLAF